MIHPDYSLLFTVYIHTNLEREIHPIRVKKYAKQNQCHDKRETEQNSEIEVFEYADAAVNQLFNVQFNKHLRMLYWMEINHYNLFYVFMKKFAKEMSNQLSICNVQYCAVLGFLEDLAL